jgi:hypothetical protein
MTRPGRWSLFGMACLAMASGPSPVRAANMSVVIHSLDNNVIADAAQLYPEP